MNNYLIIIIIILIKQDAKWKIKENEWYLYGFDTVKIKLINKTEGSAWLVE
jgi:hypothetical protein